MQSTTRISSPAARGIDVSPAIPGPVQAYWALRIGAALCFIGHGAFGFITKAAWVPYFAVVGISEAWAFRLMPLVGVLDVMAGMAVLYAPRGLALLYMVAWATLTALLRPLAGESVFEAVERAGNYGVPLAFLFLTAMPRTFAGLGSLLVQPTDDERAHATAATVLKWTTVLLLTGHGALGAITGKPMLTSHYASIGLSGEATAIIGWFEIALAAVVAIRTRIALLVGIAAWKLATESLFLVAGDPVWEFIERSGSYVAPLALAALLTREAHR